MKKVLIVIICVCVMICAHAAVSASPAGSVSEKPDKEYSFISSVDGLFTGIDDFFKQLDDIITSIDNYITDINKARRLVKLTETIGPFLKPKISGSRGNNARAFSSLDLYALDCMVDLHLHLDGAISPESARELAALQGIDIPESDEELLPLMRVKEENGNLTEFLEKFEFPNSLLQTKIGIRTAMDNLLEELKEQGVMYAEIRFAPQKSTDKGLTQEEAVIAALEGLSSRDIDAGLILCCMRGEDTHDKNLETVRLAEKYLGKGVVALDLAGDEAKYPTEDYKDIFTSAKEKGIPFTIHAGEADGPDSVMQALSFGADRIGHGIRSLEDGEFTRTLAERKVPLELCPTSNINTAIYPNMAEWPFNELTDAGIYITVNTDDPSIEGTSIKKEYLKLMIYFGIGENEIKKLLENSVKASFADAELKQKLLDNIKEEFDD